MENRQEQLVKTLQEPRVINECKTHGYSGLGSKKPPADGCKMCNEVTFFTIVAGKVKDGKVDLEALDRIEAYIHALVELCEEGRFDWVINSPEFKIQKDAVKD